MVFLAPLGKKAMKTHSQFQVNIDIKLYDDICNTLKEHPEIGDMSEFARKAFSLYIVAKRRKDRNSEDLCMVKGGPPL